MYGVSLVQSVYVRNVPNLSDAELEEVIQNGTGSMPGQSLTEQDLVDLMAYLRETYP